MLYSREESKAEELEMELVINERGRGVLGHPQVTAIHMANSFTGSLNICSVTKKQSKASCLARGREWSAGALSSAGWLAAVGMGRGEKPQSQPSCVSRTAIPVNAVYAEGVKPWGLSEN